MTPRVAHACEQEDLGCLSAGEGRPDFGIDERVVAAFIAVWGAAWRNRPMTLRDVLKGDPAVIRGLRDDGFIDCRPDRHEQMRVYPGRLPKDEKSMDTDDGVMGDTRRRKRMRALVKAVEYEKRRLAAEAAAQRPEEALS